MSQVRRRQFLFAASAGSLWVSMPGFAQQQVRVWRIGFLAGGSLQSSAAWLAAFRQGMAALGWVEKRERG